MRTNIPDSLTQAFSRTGTAHILAISGLNISIVIAMFLSLGILVFGRQRSVYIWLALAATWLYTLLAGMNPPVIRAAIMGSLLLIAEYLGRQGSAIIALAFAAALMVGIQPQLLWSVSFQLSFLAMAGLIFFYPYFRSWGKRGAARLFRGSEKIVPAVGVMTDGFASTLAAIVAVGPLIAYNFGVVTLVGLPTTLFSLPALPPIIITTALVAFVGLLAALVAQVLGWLAWLFLSYFLLLVQGFDALPYSSLQVAANSTWYVWGYYVILAGTVAILSYRSRLAEFAPRLTSRIRKLTGGLPKLHLAFSMKWLILPLLIVSVLVWAAALTMPDGKLHVSFLDVGQGDAILVQTPNGQDILIDGGPDSQTINVELGKKLPFWDKTIDLVVYTQPQADHVTGLVEVLRRYKVGQVLGPGVSYNSTVYQELCSLVEDKGIEHNQARAGQEIDLGDGTELKVLNPPESFWTGSSDNVDNNGVVLRLSCGNVSFLFTADIRQDIELELVGQRADLKSTVLKAAHHGSRTSSASQFLAAVAPDVAVVSVGEDNPYGHPNLEVIDRLTALVGQDNVYRTDENGTVEFITDGQSLWVSTSST